MDTVLENALLAGYSAIVESVDAGMDRLADYLNRRPDQEIKDADGYLITTRKAYNYFKDARTVENHWAVHFTSAEVYPLIKKNGFSHGTTVLDNLAYTAQHPEKRSKNGWLFALPVDTSYLKHYDMAYGDCAFLINTDGVIAKHIGELDVELLFRRNDVHEKIPFRFDAEAGKWTVEIDGESPRGFKTIGEIVDRYTAD